MLRLGDYVDVHGLVSRQDLNGLSGVLWKYVVDKERWGVMLQGKTFALKASNLSSRRASCVQEQQDCLLVLNRMYFAIHQPFVGTILEFLSPAKAPVTIGIEVLPAVSKCRHEDLEMTQIAVIGSSPLEEKLFLRQVYGWENVRGLSMYSVHDEAASDYPDLFVYFNDTSRGSTNEIVTQACIGGQGFIADLIGSCISGHAVIVRQGQGNNNAVVQEFPMIAILFPSAEKYARNMAPAEPLSLQQMQQTLFFYQDEDPITWARMKESERMLQSGGTRLIPNGLKDARVAREAGSMCQRMPFEHQYGLNTPCFVCGDLGCRSEFHESIDAPDPEVIVEVDHHDGIDEMAPFVDGDIVDPLADAETAELLNGTAVHASKPGTLALVVPFGRQGRQFRLKLYNSKPGRVKQALGEDLQPPWLNGAFNLVPGFTEEIWRAACDVSVHDEVTPSVQDVIILPEDKDGLLKELSKVPCRKGGGKQKTSKPSVSIADPSSIELFKDEFDTEDIAEALVGSWQSKYGTYEIHKDATGTDLIFHEAIPEGNIEGILRRSALGFWEAEVHFQSGGVEDGDFLGLLRIRLMGTVLLTQTMLAGGSGWGDSEVVRAIREHSTSAQCAHAADRDSDDASSASYSEVPSWGETLRLAVESAPIVHLNLESNGVFLAGPEDELIVTPRSAAAVSAPGCFDSLRNTADVNPRIWQR